MTTALRPRVETDLPELCRILAEQRLTSGYPAIWPLPFPVEEFIQRRGELVAWTAVRDGVPVGHISVLSAANALGQTPGDVELVDAWSSTHARSVDELAIVSTLFTAEAVRRLGTGGLLLDVAVDWIQQRGMGACLDVVKGAFPAEAMYRARGWQVVAEMHPWWLPEGEGSVLAMVLR